ncbi:putative membrane protein [Schinkia azotoformans MEV2011]|uniref:Putative membrane protein n=1 Tax=Schinkia azotoformans MEV2011 TaxID=1348973 RepID=A0A072P439_SCHAZ|nr:YetF domain-containing protein [Schinkia azotoformans]KEF40235.1 putative membrane protein [Schinkia azotoformans MEV2011]MEC1696457.1 DUF421 domain-containing protein [Schinkia azotoformans]MEC1715156.1 DUF421 domain-containing protein [Schinkia azotoformans]MEC1724128.1 DUF421 domain-containing protein [Schinkia azotoformans]MEC1739794.1 DUF421 domain-containing protein [Schinkia azotoformans]
MNYILESIAILLAGFCLVRIAGKKTVAEMSGIEIITLLAIASTISHAISEKGLIKTIVVLCTFVAFLILIQFLTIKFTIMKKIFIGKETPVIQNGKIISNNLKKLRLTVDQLEARLRENGITSISDVKDASFEVTGQLGYELMQHAKPVTIGDLEKILDEKIQKILQQVTVNESKQSPK